MSNYIIGLGKWSPFYINIILAAIFKCLRDCLLNIAPDSNFGLLGFQPILSHHTIISNIYIYISYIIFGSLFFYILNKRSIGEKQQQKEKIEYLEQKNKSFIYYKKNVINIKKILLIMLIGLIFVFHSDLIKALYLFGFSDFDIWTFDIIFILFFMNKYFVVNIYKHQKFSLYFICIISTFLIFLSMFFSPNIEGNSFQAIYNLVGNIIFCFLIFLGFILISFITAYGRVLTKVLMDLRFISPYVIIICTGIFGFILNLLILIPVSKVPCDSSNYNIFNKSCLVESKNGSYFDNIYIYFSNLNESLKGVGPQETGYTPKIKFYVEILVIVPLFLVFSYFEIYFGIKTINYLNPNYILIRDNLYYGLSRIVSFCINFKNSNIAQFFLLEFAEIIAILGYSVYLEIIELRFCGFDNKLKRKLAQIAHLESQVDMINIEEKENSDDEDDKEDENENKPDSSL